MKKKHFKFSCDKQHRINISQCVNIKKTRTITSSIYCYQFPYRTMANIDSKLTIPFFVEIIEQSSNTVHISFFWLLDLSVCSISIEKTMKILRKMIKCGRDTLTRVSSKSLSTRYQYYFILFCRYV